MKKHKNVRFLRKYDGKKYGWYLLARDFVLMLLAVALAFHLLVGVSRVDGPSMEPALSDGDLVFFTRLNFQYEKGDVVFAKMPSGRFYVKRIVATEGDVVTVRGGLLYVNDIPESGVNITGTTTPQPGIVEYPVTVEAGCYFLVGDNRPVSQDSRSFGPLPGSSIRGKILLAE